MTLLAVSCGSKEEDKIIEPTYFGVSLSIEKANATQTTITATVLCDQPWTAELEDENWGAVESPAELSDKCIIRLGFNAGETPHSNTLIVRSGTQEIRKEFSQDGIDTFLSSASVNLRGLETVNLYFKSGLDWTVSVTEGEDWIVLPEVKEGQAGRSITLPVRASSEYLDLGSRTGALRLDFGEGRFLDVPVCQFQKDAIILEREEMTIASFATPITVRVDSNIDFEVECGAEWVHYVPEVTKALNESQESFTIDANNSNQSRSARIRFFGEGIDGTVVSMLTLIQNGVDPITEERGYGIYDFNGRDYICQPNRWQTARRTGEAGRYRFVMMDFQVGTVYSLDAVPEALADGEFCPLTLSVYRRGNQSDVTAMRCQQVAADDESRWLRCDNGAAFVIKK